MASPWALPLMLLLLGMVGAAPSTAPPSSYDQVIAAAVDIYNQQQKPEYAFRLLEAEPQPDWNSSAQTNQVLRFSIKETVCRPSEKADLSQCDYKPDGVDRDCSGFYSPQQNPPTIMVQCEDVDQELDRVTRFRWRRFFRKAKRFLKRHGVSIAIGTVRLLRRFG
ncbi:cathelicidin antimicrobial peptide [Varanus komodoensis]|uniref:cathelicidin antimicrobial peptide n=1 Tax=Varanus komodoensis TaxID=61221 RepID=UPI001CF77432|nr:cathelicidin antimicrobial peptide [Varanus komodoensis]